LSKFGRLAAVAFLLLLAGQFLPFAAPSTAAAPSQSAALILTIIPPRLPSDGGTYPAVVVSIVDSGGNPTAALNNVTVFLTSSQTNIAMVPNNVTITPGHEYAIANVTTTTTPGTAMITASSEGLSTPQTLSSPLTTVIPSGYPSKLVVYTSPETFLSGSDQGVVRVEVVDDAGLPSKAIVPVTAYLTSSNESIASLGPGSLTVAAGSITADGTFTTQNPGDAVITAVSNGYSTGTALVTVDHPGACQGSCGPSKLSLRLIPGVLPTDGKTYNAIEISLQTQSGSPATSSSDTIVQLTSDESEVASVPSFFTIPAGSISALAPVTTSALAGVANITATAAGLLPATVGVATVIPAPSQLQIYTAPPSIGYDSNGNFPIFVVQLQDSSGNPARARNVTSVTVTSSNGSMLSNYVNLTIPQGSDYIFGYLHIKGVGKTSLTATAQDLSSSQTSLTSVASPLSVGVVLSSTSPALPSDGPTLMYANQTATFVFSAYLDGQPVQNMNVTWSVNAGSLTSYKGNTGGSGTVATVFIPGSFGAYNITATASSPQTGALSIVKPFTVAQVQPVRPPSLIKRIIEFWYVMVVAAGIAVVGAFYLLRMRRKKQREEIEAGFEITEVTAQTAAGRPSGSPRARFLKQPRPYTGQSSLGKGETHSPRRYGNPPSGGPPGRRGPVTYPSCSNGWGGGGVRAECALGGLGRVVSGGR
jgi:hypothetical protein